MTKERISIILQKISTIKEKVEKKKSSKHLLFDRKLLNEIIDILERTVKFLEKKITYNNDNFKSKNR